MPGFNQILAEIETAQGNPALGNPFDYVRRKYIGLLAAKTGRHTIVLRRSAKRARVCSAR